MEDCLSAVRYSRQAEADVAEILDYSNDRWGEERASAYLTDLVDCFEQIAKMPSLGRTSRLIHPDLRRIERGRHVIFYRPERNGVFIIRVLHQSMLPTQDRLIDG